MVRFALRSRFTSEIMKHIDKLNIFITLDDICFSHAGITKTWLKNNKINVHTLNVTWRTDPRIAAKLCFQIGRFYSANDVKSINCMLYKQVNVRKYLK